MDRAVEYQAKKPASFTKLLKKLTIKSNKKIKIPKNTSCTLMKDHQTQYEEPEDANTLSTDDEVDATFITCPDMSCLTIQESFARAKFDSTLDEGVDTEIEQGMKQATKEAEKQETEPTIRKSLEEHREFIVDFHKMSHPTTQPPPTEVPCQEHIEMHSPISNTTTTTSSTHLHAIKAPYILPHRHELSTPLSPPHKEPNLEAMNRFGKRVMSGVQNILVKPLHHLTVPSPFTKPAPRVIVIIGIHGWFAPKWLEAVTGRRSGTSERFTGHAAKATRQYLCEKYGSQVAAGYDIIEIPLYHEAKVEERVHVHVQQLKNRRNDLERADLILFAAHSQGTPVSAMIIEILLNQKETHGIHLNIEKQRICLLGMAGIGHGPFPLIKTVIPAVDSPAARELFEFCDGTSRISVKFEKAISSILEKGVKVLAMASYLDEVVPFYSATLASFSHPLLKRAVFIHPPDFKDNFVTQLIKYSLMLRNRGLSDYGLSIHISPLLAGSTLSNKLSLRHSTVYDDHRTYLHALCYALDDTQPTITTPIKKRPFNINKLQDQSPNELGFIIGRLVSAGVMDPHIRQDATLLKELCKLIELYDTWIPTGWQGKEIKNRLHGLSSETLRYKLQETIYKDP